MAYSNTRLAGVRVQDGSEAMPAASGHAAILLAVGPRCGHVHSTELEAGDRRDRALRMSRGCV